jgi:hypothetical protein
MVKDSSYNKANMLKTLLYSLAEVRKNEEFLRRRTLSIYNCMQDHFELEKAE